MKNRFTYLIFILTSYAVFCLIFSMGELKYILGDGVKVLDYICAKTWLLGRGEDAGFLAKMTSNALYNYFYPGFLHCNGSPPFLNLIIINSIILIIIILLLNKFYKNNIYFFLGSLSLFYGIYSLQVASKELILGLLFLFSIHNYFAIKRNNLSVNKKSFLFLIGLFLLILNAFARPTYIILLIPYLTLIIDKKRFLKKDLFINYLTILVLLTPLIFNFIWKLNGLDFLTGDLKLIMDDYLERYTRDNYASTSLNIESIFTTSGYIKRILLNIFGYRHLILGDNIPFYIASIASKISIMSTLIISIIFLIRPKVITINYSQMIAERKLWIASALISVFIYPFPHDRYFLPLILLMLYVIYDKRVIWISKPPLIYNKLKD